LMLSMTVSMASAFEARVMCAKVARVMSMIVSVLFEV
jgi:hypothetical protein